MNSDTANHNRNHNHKIKEITVSMDGFLFFFCLGIFVVNEISPTSPVHAAQSTIICIKSTEVSNMLRPIKCQNQDQCRCSASASTSGYASACAARYQYYYQCLCYLVPVPMSVLLSVQVVLRITQVPQ